MKYLPTLLLFVCIAGCDPPTDEPKPQTTEAKPTKRDGPRMENPNVYMAIANQRLLEIRGDITKCSLPWKGRFPDRELHVHLVFELDPRGNVERARATTPEEAADLGHCMEKVVATTKFPPGAPPKPFEKKMVFNPQDQNIKALRERQKGR